ncbi:hypothetical protein C6P46_006427 [Rhodotorula mucilaginosa]|uniref:Ima1 N-terminal domain-containing protein n=1 Tax=Rhodotorula mucilaginosa TaxID=5537 RepID=A0A9P7B957_RHOMI|nr:hypothetical protein C6P46_006427 [Rhodotorula mucilaginosa]
MAWLWSGSANRVTCFYCNSHLPLLPPASTPKGKHRQLHHDDAALAAIGSRGDFWCSVCGQITRKDPQTGEILSDEAAHHDPALNNDSFKLRALQLHLLASYPLDESSPSSDDSSARPSHESEIDPYPPLDEYRRSLDLRYPLVCAECAPAVESTIRERDYRVKAQALGWRLRETQRRREEEEKRSDEARRREGRNWAVQGAVWRLRGVAWASTHVTAIAAAYSDYFGPPQPLRAFIERKIGPPLPVGARHLLLVFLLALLSLFWSFWDPTWNAARLERARGRDPIVRYRGAYLAIQMMAYFARLGMVISSWRQQEAEPLSSRHSWTALTVLICSLTALLSATLIPTLRPRTPVRLQARGAKSSSTSLAADSSSSTTSFQSADPLEPLANLSLSHNGSLLVPSPPTTPTPKGVTTRRMQNAEIRNQQSQSPRDRRGSFSLGLRSWTRSSPSPLGVVAASSRSTNDDDPNPLVVDDDESNVDDARETSMDWCPTPPPPPVSTSSSSTSPAFETDRANPNDSPSSSARFSTNHVTFARQRFVPPDTRKPTGLEGMFERVVAVRDDEALLSGGAAPVVAGRDVEMKSLAESTGGSSSSAWGLARWWK